MFVKKELEYLCVYLNRKNRLWIKQEGILFNIRAETHIAKLIDDFNTGIYVLASLPLIDIVSGEAMPLGFSKRTIICAIDTEGETYMLNLRKV